MKDEHIMIGARSLRYGSGRQGNVPHSGPRPPVNSRIRPKRKPAVSRNVMLPNGDPPSLMLWGEEA